jgi:NADH-quinone oxidoreductase subunit G
VLRVLGTLLNLSGFEYQSSEDVREELRKLCTDSAAVGSASAGSSATAYKGSFRVEQPSAGADVLDLSMYHIDALVRRAPSLQKTREGRTLAVTY